MFIFGLLLRKYCNWRKIFYNLNIVCFIYAYFFCYILFVLVLLSKMSCLSLSWFVWPFSSLSLCRPDTFIHHSSCFILHQILNNLVFYTFSREEKSRVFPSNPCCNPSGQCLRVLVNKPLDIFILLDLITVCQRRQLYPPSLSYNHYKPLQLLHLRNVHNMVMIDCNLTCLMHLFQVRNIFEKGLFPFPGKQHILSYHLT